MTVYDKLLQVQSELKAPKSQYNAFGKYNYRNCEDILEAVKPLLKEVGAILTVGDSVEAVGNRIYIKATAEFVDCETEKKISSTAYAREEDSKKGMDSAQITGSTSSYARKYALNGLFCIDDSRDSDSGTEEQKECFRDRLNKMTLSEMETTLEEELKRTGIKINGYLTYFQIKEQSELTREQLGSILLRLKEHPTKLKE